MFSIDINEKLGSLGPKLKNFPLWGKFETDCNDGFYLWEDFEPPK